MPRVTNADITAGFENADHYLDGAAHELAGLTVEGLDQVICERLRDMRACIAAARLDLALARKWRVDHPQPACVDCDAVLTSFEGTRCVDCDNEPPDTGVSEEERMELIRDDAKVDGLRRAAGL